MKATANVLCYKSKVLSNGEHPTHASCLYEW